MPIHIQRGNYYTSEEAAEYLGVSEAYVCRLIREGQLPAIKIGKLSWLLAADELRQRKKNPPPLGRPKS